MIKKSFAADGVFRHGIFPLGTADQPGYSRRYC